MRGLIMDFKCTFNIGVLTWYFKLTKYCCISGFRDIPAYIKVVASSAYPFASVFAPGRSWSKGYISRTSSRHQHFFGVNVNDGHVWWWVTRKCTVDVERCFSDYHGRFDRKGCYFCWICKRKSNYIIIPCSVVFFVFLFFFLFFFFLSSPFFFFVFFFFCFLFFVFVFFLCVCGGGGGRGGGGGGGGGGGTPCESVSSGISSQRKPRSIHTVWSWSLLSTNTIIGFYMYIMHVWRAKARMIHCSCARWSESESVHLAHVLSRKHAYQILTTLNPTFI